MATPTEKCTPTNLVHLAGTIVTAQRADRAWCRAYLSEMLTQGILSHHAVETIWQAVYGEAFEARQWEREP